MISLVELGVIKDVEVEDGRVRIEFTPTFLGCPALELMQQAMEAKVAELGARADVRVVLDDSWSTDKHHADGPGEAPRGGLRAAGTARGRDARRSSSSSAAASAAPTAARRRRGSRISSARLRAARSATATAAASRSSSSRRSSVTGRVSSVSVEILYCPT